MKAGEVFSYKGVTYKVESEKSEFSCEGCAIMHIVRDNRGNPLRDKFGNVLKLGCNAKSEDKIFDNCKRDHVVFVKV